jgi:hypothetical protein
MVPMAEDQVVQQGNRQQLSRMKELPGQVEVSGTGFDIAGGMIVGDDQPRCRALANGVAEDIAGMGEGFGGGTDRDQAMAKGSVFGVEHQHGKAFLVVPHQLGADVGDRRLGAIDRVTFRRFGLEGSFAQFDRRQDCRRLGLTNAIDRHQLRRPNIAEHGHRVLVILAQFPQQQLAKANGGKLAGALAGSQEQGDQFGVGQLPSPNREETFSGPIAGVQILDTEAVSHIPIEPRFWDGLSGVKTGYSGGCYNG